MQFQSSESQLHPLLATARLAANEDSVDNTAENVHGETQDEYARRIFGMPTISTQGPAGSRVPDLDDPRRHHRPAAFGSRAAEEEGPEFRYLEDPEAPPDAAGPHAPVEVEMTEADYADEAGEAAAAAVLQARRQGRNSSGAILDALEAAEAAYEQQQQQQQQQGGQGEQGEGQQLSGQQQQETAYGSPGGRGLAHAASSLVKRKRTPTAAEAASAAATAGGGGDVAPPPDTPRKAAISEGTRERIIQKLFESLQANPRYSMQPARDVMCHAQEVEDALFTSSHSKQVYLSKVSNAVRLARSVDEVADIPRIASGEPREVAEGHTAGEPTPFISGLQGYVIKPEVVL